MTKQLEALIAEMKAAAEKATPGPYSIDHTGYSLNCSEGTFGDFLDMDNATFALEANPESILTLIAALEQAQQQNKELESTLEREREKSRRVMSRNHQLEASPLAVKLTKAVEDVLAESNSGDEKCPLNLRQ